VKGSLAQIDADGCDVHGDDPPDDVDGRNKSYSAADHLINPGHERYRDVTTEVRQHYG